MTRTPDNIPEKGDPSMRKTSAQHEERDALQEYNYRGTEVEPFVPTDVFPSTQVRGKRRHPKRKKRALWALMVAGGVLLLAVGCVFAYALLLDPSTQFSGDVQQDPTEIVSVAEPDETNKLGAPTPTPTLDPYQVVSAQADLSMMQNIVAARVQDVRRPDSRSRCKNAHSSFVSP